VSVGRNEHEGKQIEEGDHLQQKGQRAELSAKCNTIIAARVPSPSGVT
jgi:hypothetical protein